MNPASNDSISREKRPHERLLAPMYIFEVNYHELNGALEFYNERGVREFGAMKKHYLQDKFWKNVSVLLTTFLAAAKMFRDNSSSTFRGTRMEEAYKEEITVLFGDDDLAAFIFLLRDYCVHEDSAPLISSMNLIAGSARFRIDNTRMLNFANEKLEQLKKGQSPASTLRAVKFLQAQTGNIELVECLRAYHQKN